MIFVCAETRSKDLSAIPPRSKTGELTPFSWPRSKLELSAFQVGNRLFEWLFWRPFTREREMIELLWIRLDLGTTIVAESTFAYVFDTGSVSVTIVS